MRKFALVQTIAIIITVCGPAALLGQTKSTNPVWWLGGSIGINFNYYGGEVQQLNSSTLATAAMTKGSGKGLYLAPLVEYRPDPVWGGIFALGFDDRGGSFDEATNAGVTSSLTTSLNYLSLEPSLRMTPFKSPLYFFAGPRLGINVSKSFSLTESNAPANVDGDWSGVRGALFGGQVGVGFDIPVSRGSSHIDLSPYISVNFGQGPRSEESWSLSTVRFGLALKVGSSFGGSETSGGDADFAIRAPKLIPIERRIHETFPMRTNVFFDEGSDVIPKRYILLSKDEASHFKEEQLLTPEPKDLTGRSRRQLVTYHNVLNVIGDRMRLHPNATVTLTGSSQRGAANGRTIAEAVKQYLVNVFGIEERRIVAEGREKPLVPSVQTGASHELELVTPEDRRVDITSPSAEILEPVQIVSLQEDPLDSDVIFTVPDAETKFSSWSVEVADQSGAVKHFGPFTRGEERISGRTILSGAMKGSYTISMVGTTKDGETVRNERKVDLQRTDQPDEELGLRFSIVFEFDQSRTVATYERFLTSTVAPLITEGASVIIHGHTDIIGEESHNLKLSRDRAEETMNVLQRALTAAGKRRVKFDTYGFGEDPRRAPFENALPEERFYNRTVIIDIVPE